MPSKVVAPAGCTHTMDESWRMRMGMPSSRHHHLPRRRSVEDHTTRRSMNSIDSNDFSDVFGGPPRTVTSRKFSGDFSQPSDSFYQEIFKPPQFVSYVNKGGGRNLPAFRIPANGERFYGDVFGGKEEKVEVEDEGRLSRERSRPNSKAKSNSKSNSSSVLSSEELSPLPLQVNEDDVTLSSFTSRLRSTNVPCRWNSVQMRPEEQPSRQGVPSFPSNNPPFPADGCSYMEDDYNDKLKSSYFGFSRQVSSPEIITIGPNSYQSVKLSFDDLELHSPSSPVSSLSQEVETKADVQFNSTKEGIQPDDEEVVSSYVIEINPDHRNETAEAVSLDEAIAWAKGKYQAQCSDEENKNNRSTMIEDEPTACKSIEQQVYEERTTQSLTNEIKLFDDDITLWSSGNKSNIRLLLSTLHHILWPSSGWNAISITSLTEGSQVKKAYQKARLCLHPDKLQQRGATLHQKYVAEKAFSALQDAWSMFLSQDAILN